MAGAASENVYCSIGSVRDLELNCGGNGLARRGEETSDYGSNITNQNTWKPSNEMTDLLMEERVEEPQAAEQGGERIAWEFHHVTLQRMPGYGYGIAVSGGRDNPHFTNGDPSIAISDVLHAGPAGGKLMVNDRVICANNISLEGVDYATAVQVLRDSGQLLNLVVKRRVVLASSPEPQTLRVVLTKDKKREEFGIVLGCKIFIKEILSHSVAQKEGNLKEGDFVERISNTPVDGLTLKEARKLVESANNNIDLVVNRDPYQSNLTKQPPKFSHMKVDNNRHESNQNLYVPSPTMREEKNNITRADQLQRKETERGLSPSIIPRIGENGQESLSLPASETRTLPLSEKKLYEKTNDALDLGLQLNLSNLGDSSDKKTNAFEHSPRQNDEESSLSTTEFNGDIPGPRLIQFQKRGSVGIRLTGGNDVGIFVTAVQPGSPASQQGLQPGDKILKVNDMDLDGVTREEAVLFLLSLKDQIDLIAQLRKEEYDKIIQKQQGDSFYIKTHFNYDHVETGELAFTKSDVFHVVDTLHNGVVGSWQAFRMDNFLSGVTQTSEQIKKGVIPNKSRAEEIANKQFNEAKKEQNSSVNSKGSFFKRRKAQNRRRSKSVGKDHWEDLVWSETLSQFPAYERVSLTKPNFPRPVLIFGPVADIARERLLQEVPFKFSSIQQGCTGEEVRSGIIRLSSIRDNIAKGHHALLDVAPTAVDKLNYAKLYPIVILTMADSKQTIKECRSGLPKKAHLSSKKLLEQCVKIQKLWGHMLTCTLILHAGDDWYSKLTDLIDKQQGTPIWISNLNTEDSFSDEFLFPMNTHFGYTSGAESDGEFCGDETPRKSVIVVKNRVAIVDTEGRKIEKTNSDPNLARDDVNIDTASPINLSQHQQDINDLDFPVTQREHASGPPSGTSSPFGPKGSHSEKIYRSDLRNSQYGKIPAKSIPQRGKTPSPLPISVSPTQPQSSILPSSHKGGLRVSRYASPQGRENPLPLSGAASPTQFSESNVADSQKGRPYAQVPYESNPSPSPPPPPGTSPPGTSPPAGTSPPPGTSPHPEHSLAAASNFRWRKSPQESIFTENIRQVGVAPQPTGSGSASPIRIGLSERPYSEGFVSNQKIPVRVKEETANTFSGPSSPTRPKSSYSERAYRGGRYAPIPGYQSEHKSEEIAGLKAEGGSSVSFSPPAVHRYRKPSKKSATERLFGLKGDNEQSSNHKSDAPAENGNHIEGGEKTRKATNDGDLISNNKNGVRGSADLGHIPASPAVLSSPAGSYTNQGAGGDVGAGNQGDTHNKYRYSDYKPVPLSKASTYKPIPPPKPKTFSRHDTDSQPLSLTTTESNYINGNFITSPKEEGLVPVLPTRGASHLGDGNAGYSPASAQQATVPNGSIVMSAPYKSNICYGSGAVTGRGRYGLPPGGDKQYYCNLPL